MVTLADALSVLLPDAVPLRDYVVSDDGSGAVISAWNLADPQPTQAEIDAVTAEQVQAARTAKTRQEAGTAALYAADGLAVANRAAESVGATRDNNLAETLKALADLLSITPTQLADRITLNRQSAEPPPGAPTPADTVASATTRYGPVEIFGMNSAYIAGGAGDPIQ